MLENVELLLNQRNADVRTETKSFVEVITNCIDLAVEPVVSELVLETTDTAE